MGDAGRGKPPPHGVVEFGLFGGVRVVRNGADVELTQPKQRAILALLLATPSEPVSVAEMIDALWAGDPAATVLNQVRRHIGMLRRVCEPGLPRRHAGRYLCSAGGGYRLALTPDTSDVLRFRALVGQAERLATTSRLHEAFRAYLDALRIATAPAGDEALRMLPVFLGLEDERVRVIAAAAELAEGSDEHAALLPVLRAATGRHRLHETLHAHEITALTRTGRTAEALAVYQHMRRTLDQELGASPGPALAAAHTLALRGQQPEQDGGDAATPVHTALPDVPAQLPSPLPGFAGRRRELQLLRERTAVSGRVLITGMAGVGKTSLALRYASEIAEEFPDGALYINLRGFDATAAPTEPLDALQDLLHGLGVAPQAIPNSLGARSGLLRSVLADRQVLMVLDNARDYRQVEPLLPGTGANFVIVTSRNALPGLVAFQQARPVALEPFGDDEAIEFFTRRLSAARVGGHRAALVALGRACGGLPLALALLAARAEANPRFPLDLFVAEFTGRRARLAVLDGGSSEVDLAAVFSWSQQGLSGDAARLFAVLGAHPGPAISTAAAVSMSGLDERRTRAVLAELVQANVLGGAVAERHVFHDLVREYALGLLGNDIEKAARRLVSHYAGSLRNAIATFEQPSAGRASGAALPGIVAERFASSAEATAWYAEHRAILHAVCRRAIEMGDHTSGLVLMLDWRPMSQAVDARHDMLPFAELAIEAADHIADPALRAEAYRDSASNFARTDQLDRARRCFETAAAIYQESGDRLGLSNLYRSMGVTLPMDPAERIKLLRESADIVRDLGEQPSLAMAMHSLGLGYLWADRHDQALRALDEARDLAATTGTLDHLEPHLLSARSRALARAGRLDQAAADADRALKTFRNDGATHAELRLLHSHGEVLTALGRYPEAAEAWQRYLTLATGPEHIRETLALDDDTDGETTIRRIRTRLADLEDPKSSPEPE